MTANRAMLRLAAIHALNNFNQQPWPTLAGPYIFDSRIEAIEDTKADHAYPLCVVYTDYDKDGFRHGSAIDKSRLVTITFELLVVQQAPQDDKTVIECPQTDSELETVIDIFENQIFKALVGTNSAAECFKYLVQSYETVISRRGASSESGKRLAARQITIEAAIPREPAKSVVPGPVNAFLTDLEAAEEYRDRVPLLRDMYLLPAGRTDAEALLDANGWSTELGGILGIPRGPQLVMPPNVTYFYEAS